MRFSRMRFFKLEVRNPGVEETTTGTIATKCVFGNSTATLRLDFLPIVNTVGSSFEMLIGGVVYASVKIPGTSSTSSSVATVITAAGARSSMTSMTLGSAP